MHTLQDEDVRFIARRLPADVREVIQEHNLMLAGGFIRATIAGEEVTDIDLFGADAATLRKAAKALAEKRSDAGGWALDTDNAITIITPARPSVQFITRWMFADATAIVEHFDFTIARAVIWMTPMGDWTSACDERFYCDLAARRLVYAKPRDADAGSSVLRMCKFLRRGYRIAPESIASLLAATVAKIDPTQIDMGNSESVAFALTGLLREVDPSTAGGDGESDFTDETSEEN